MTNQEAQYGSKLANHPKPAIALTAITYLLLGTLETLPGTYLPALAYFLVLGVLALYVMPYVLGLPNGRKPLKDYCQDIRLLPVRPVGRNVLLGLLLAILTLFSILLASLLTGHFVLDGSTVPALRWVKGLTRGIWEEVFFRGIILVLFMRIYPLRNAVFFFHISIRRGAFQPSGCQPSSAGRCGEHFLHGVTLYLSGAENRLATACDHFSLCPRHLCDVGSEHARGG